MNRDCHSAVPIFFIGNCYKMTILQKLPARLLIFTKLNLQNTWKLYNFGLAFMVDV